jgi:hypothetical protein
MKVESVCPLKNFRKFLILSTCNSFIPREYLEDDTVFPERMVENGTMYIEAEDKETLKKIEELTFVRALNVLGIIYNSKSGNTKLKWRSTKEKLGRLTGEASANSLVNLFEAGALERTYAYENKESNVLEA